LLYQAPGLHPTAKNAFKVDGSGIKPSAQENVMLLPTSTLEPTGRLAWMSELRVGRVRDLQTFGHFLDFVRRATDDSCILHQDGTSIAIIWNAWWLFTLVHEGGACIEFVAVG
jgi:hypothetical protein